jgi:hypothetical protein
LIAARLAVRGEVANEGPARIFFKSCNTAVANSSDGTEAPTGFDNLTNGFIRQGPPFESINENVVPQRSMNDSRFVFEEVETVVDGLGPTYNAQSCRECHQNVVTGGASQVADHRAGHTFHHEFLGSSARAVLSIAHSSSKLAARKSRPDVALEILLDAEVKFPREPAIPYNLACYYCQLGEMEKAKRYLKEAFEIDLNWRKAALDDEDLRPFWDSLQTTVE